MDAAAFRVIFPEFGNELTFPAALINHWLVFATAKVNAKAFGVVTETAIGLLAAHHITIGRQGEKTAEFGGNIGEMTGPKSGSTVDKVSGTYDTGAATIEGAGDYNLTTYGVRFYREARLAGAGGIQLGVDAGGCV